MFVLWHSTRCLRPTHTDVGELRSTQRTPALQRSVALYLHLAESEAKEVFALADKLDHFKHPLEAPVKVAFMGTKTFRFEEGAEKNEVKFNYTEDVNAQALQDWFERMAESAEHRDNVERAAKYDHLGLVQAVNLLASAYMRHRLVAVDQFLPILDRVAKNETYMHSARALAAEMAESIRKGQP